LPVFLFTPDGWSLKPLPFHMGDRRTAHVE